MGDQTPAETRSRGPRRSDRGRCPATQAPRRHAAVRTRGGQRPRAGHSVQSEARPGPTLAAWWTVVSASASHTPLLVAVDLHDSVGSLLPDGPPALNHGGVATQRLQLLARPSGPHP